MILFLINLVYLIIYQHGVVAILDVNLYETEKVIAFICVVDALNFCFWPVEKLNLTKEYEYDDLVQNLKNLFYNEGDFFKAKNLSEVNSIYLKEKVFDNLDFPLLEERVRSLNELGDFISNVHNGSFVKFIENNDRDCTKIMLDISRGVTTFRDETIYKGKQIFIYKRAQILAADLFSALKELKTQIILKNSDKLTTFADYRVPQILRQLGILEYDQCLSKLIDEKTEIQPNSIEEIELRANTIICVEMIKQAISKNYNRNILSLEVDYILWNEGEKLRKKLLPHHRTLTIFY